MTERPADDLQEPTLTEDDGTSIERLAQTECWKLLARSPVGRIGVVVDGAAEIYPVNFIVDRTSSVTPTILFRTDPGTKLAGLTHNPRVSFEVDHLDTTDRTGWSILVKGRAQQIRELVDPDDRQRFEQMPLRHWYGGPKRHTIRLVPTEITGRRIARHDDAVLHDLPSVEEWTGREVWIPPVEADAAPMKPL